MNYGICMDYGLWIECKRIGEWAKERKNVNVNMNVNMSVCLCWQKVNGRHRGFARGHPPYYWPGLSELNFPDQTGWGAVSLV